MNLEFSFSLGMSCPSWQWHKTGYRWSPVRTIPVAPLWCDLGRCSRTVVVIKLRRISALQAQFVACDEIFVSQRYPQEMRDLWSQRTRFLRTWSSSDCRILCNIARQPGSLSFEALPSPLSSCRKKVLQILYAWGTRARWPPAPRKMAGARQTRACAASI